MKIVNNIKSFLYDKQYFINIFDNCVHVFNYLDLESFSDDYINLRMDTFKLRVKGSNLAIVKMEEREILVRGEISGVEMVNE